MQATSDVSTTPPTISQLDAQRAVNEYLLAHVATTLEIASPILIPDAPLT